MKRLLSLAALMLAAAAPTLAQETAAPATKPQVTLHTTMGDIVILLDPVGAPKTAAQFRGLVEAGYFDGAIVYRVEPGFVIQLGDLGPNLEYREPPLPAVPLETATNHHFVGAVAMAHGDDPNDGRATFYIDLSDNSGLDANSIAPPNTTGYAVFGKVMSGMEVAQAIAGVELASEGGPFPGKLPKVPVLVTKAEITKTQP